MFLEYNSSRTPHRGFFTSPNSSVDFGSSNSACKTNLMTPQGVYSLFRTGTGITLRASMYKDPTVGYEYKRSEGCMIHFMF